MDTLKSYFNKMKLLPGHGHRSWKFSRKSSSKKAKYNRSKSQNDASFDSYDSPNGAHFIDSESKENIQTKSRTLTSMDSNRELARSPPAKPPRKDQIFTVNFNTHNQQDNFGLIIGNSSQDTCLKDSIVNALSYTVDLNDSIDEMSYQTISPIKVFKIIEGSIIHADGSLHVHDEIMEINGQSVQGDSIVNIRQLLERCINSGHVTLKVRRKRKRQAPNPPGPSHNLNQSFDSASSAKLIEATENKNLSRPSPFTQSASCLETERCRFSQFTLNSITNSENSLNVSNDDVFMESTTEYHLNGIHNKYAELSCHRKRTYNDKNSLGVYISGDKYRTHSASAVEDIQTWDCDNEDDSNRSKMAEAKRHYFGIGTACSYTESSDADQYQSDSEVLMCERMYQQRKGSKCSDLFRQANNATPTSLWSFDGSEYEYTSCNSSPAFGKKRMITKLHILKETNSLGLHVAGGKGSKRGDIGIFVAGISENGPAFRDGRLKRGDELLMINGRSLIGATHTEAVDMLRTAPKLVQLVIAAKVQKSGSMASTISNFSTSLVSPTTPDIGSQSIPEVLAQTPQGTVVDWEELYDRFKSDGFEDKPPTGLASSTSNKYRKRHTRSPSPHAANNTNDPTGHVGPMTICVNKGQGGKGLGFTIVGGSDTAIGHLGVIVRRIFPSGIVAQDGRIREGDEILEVNFEPLTDLTHREVLRKFRQLKKGPVHLTFRKRLRSPHCSPGRSPHLTPSASCDGSPVSTPAHSPHSSMTNLCDLDVSMTTHRPTFSVPVHIPHAKSASGNTSIVERLSPDNKPKVKQEIQLLKDCGEGLGISVIRKTYDGDSEILVQDITQGSPAYKDGRLRKGDMIMEVNRKSMTNMTLLDAYQLFRNLEPGLVDIVIRRRDSVQKIQLEIIELPKTGSCTIVSSDDDQEEINPSYFPSDSDESDLPSCTDASWEGRDHVTSLNPEPITVSKELLRKRLSTVSEEAGAQV